MLYSKDMTLPSCTQILILKLEKKYIQIQSRIPIQNKNRLCLYTHLEPPTKMGDMVIKVKQGGLIKLENAL